MSRSRALPYLAAGLAACLLAVPAAAERAYAPQAVPRVAVFPKLIGVGSNGAVEVQVEMPPRAGDPTLSVFEGTVGKAKKEDRLYYGLYRPPITSKGPGFEVILARSETGAVGVGILELHATAKLVLDGQPPNTAVTVRIGGRDFGPFMTDARGEANLQIGVPPGIDEVEILPPGREPVKERLALPPLRRVFLKGPPVAVIGKTVEITAVAIDRKGKVLTGKPKVTARHGDVRDVDEIGPGVWRIRLVPEGGPMTVSVKNGASRGRLRVGVPWPKRTPTPTPTPTPAPTPGLVAETPVLLIPPPPSCEELKIGPGAILTASRLKARIEEASRESDLIARRDRLIALECVFPEEHAIRLQLTAAWLLLGDNQTALDTVVPLLQDEEEIHDEHRALGLSYQASALLRLGDTRGAAESARGALTLLPGLYSASYTLGESLFLEKDFAGAQAALMSAYHAAPGFASDIDHTMLAEILEAKGQPTEALPHRIALARFEPNDVERWREAARSAEAAGRWARAHEAWLIIAASTLPGFAANAEALSGAARAAVAAPKNPEIAWLENALSSERAGKLDRASFLFEKAVEANGRNVAARYHAARVLARRGAHEQAATHVSKVLNATPNWVPALVLAGDVDRANGETERALTRYREAAGTTPAVPMSTVARWRLSEMARN